MGSLSERRYVINDLPPPTSFATKCHRHADEISRKLDTFFLEHWPFPDEAARAAFLASRCPLWGCWAFPLADDDRVEDVIKLVTLLFLLDDVVEEMSIARGKALYARLTAIATGEAAPDRSNPYEWITHDVWTSMRARDHALADEVLAQFLVCIHAQVDKARLECENIGTLLAQRIKEAGCGIVAACIRYGMQLRIPPAALASVATVVETYSRLGIIVNDIQSFDKELRQWETRRVDGAFLLNVVQAIVRETGLPARAAKRIGWALCREWEGEFWRGVDAWEDKMAVAAGEGEGERGAEGKVGLRETTRTPSPSLSPSAGNAAGACGRGYEPALRLYLKALEWALGGNEKWSAETGRFHGC